MARARVPGILKPLARGEIVVRALERDAWSLRKKSRLLPTLELPELLSHLTIEPQSDAVRAYRDALRGKPRAR